MKIDQKTKEVNEMKKDSYYDDKGERFMALMSFIYDNHVNATVRHEQDGVKVRCTFKF